MSRAACSAGENLSEISSLKEGTIELGEMARKDERSAFQHGNDLSSITVSEHLKWMQAKKRALKSASSQDKDCFPHKRPEKFHLNRRAVGWLRYLYQKCITKDDWSADGDPQSWWDKSKFAPMSSFPRFDLHESSYFILLAADRTPAWSEVYERIMDGLASRYVTFWGAVDWMTQFGHDPDRKSYPSPYRGSLIAESLFGSYDAPGWVANGVKHPDRPDDEPIVRDPIDAHAMLFYKGWMTLVLGIRCRVSSSMSTAAWSWPSLDDTAQDKRWNYDTLAKKLESQFLENDGRGLH